MTWVLQTLHVVCVERVSRSDRCVNILSVGLQGSSASGLPALGQLVRPRLEVPSVDRGFEVTSAMPFLKPDVAGVRLLGAV